MSLRTARLHDGTRVSCVSRGEAYVIDRHVLGYVEGTGLPADCVVLDVGAHIGLLGVRILQRCPQARVLACEPMPRTYLALERNAQRHGHGRLRPRRVAVGRERGTVAFTWFPFAPSLSTKHPGLLACNAAALAEMIRGTMEDPPTELRWIRHLPGFVSAMAARWMLRGARRVRCREETLSSLIATHGLERVDLLKVDAEGAEMDVLLGLDESHWPRVRAVACEVHLDGEREHRLLGLLRDRGLENIHLAHEAGLEQAPLAVVHARRVA